MGQLEMVLCVIGVGTILGPQYVYRTQHIPTDPHAAYRLRQNYAYRHGQFGDDYINLVSNWSTFTEPS